MLEKPKRGLWILKRRVQELFTHREGISISRARHKGWQPLIESAKRDFKIIYIPKSGELLFFYYIIFIFLQIDKGVALAPMYPQVQWGNQTYVVLYVGPCGLNNLKSDRLRMQKKKQSI